MRPTETSAHLPRCSEGVLDVLDSIAWAPAGVHADAAWLSEETGRLEVDVHRICRVAAESLLARRESVPGQRSAMWRCTARGHLALNLQGARAGLWSPVALLVLTSATDGDGDAIDLAALEGEPFLAEHLRALRGRGVLALSRPVQGGSSVHVIGQYGHACLWALASRHPRSTPAEARLGTDRERLRKRERA